MKRQSVWVNTNNGIYISKTFIQTPALTIPCDLLLLNKEKGILTCFIDIHNYSETSKIVGCNKYSSKRPQLKQMCYFTRGSKFWSQMSLSTASFRFLKLIDIFVSLPDLYFGWCLRWPVASIVTVLSSIVSLLPNHRPYLERYCLSYSNERRLFLYQNKMVRMLQWNYSNSVFKFWRAR